MFDAVSASDSRLQRSHGDARLRFEARDGETRLIGRYAASPARILTPRITGTAPEAVIANTAGGVAGGDSLALSITVGAGGNATVSGQAAEKIYRAIDAPALMTTTIGVATDATLEWLPQETILFDGAMLDRRITIDIAPSARLLMAETIVLGRKDYGEQYQSGYLNDRWRLDRETLPVWRDSLRIEGGSDSLAAATGFRSARVLSTILYAAPDAAEFVEPMREFLAKIEQFTGATFVRGLLVARMLGEDAGAQKQALSEVIGAFRGLALKRPAMAPRVWLC
jgi:urease accessory protein